MGHKNTLNELHAGTNNAVVYSIQRSYDTQRKPYVHPLSFFTAIYENTISVMPYFNEGLEHSCYDLPPSIATSERQNTLNKCYGKFQNSAVETAQGANNLLEMKGNFATIAKHATTLAKAYTQVKKGNVSGALKTLGVSNPKGSLSKRITKRAKQPADAWLEMHFGWVPLAKDIGTSLDAIQKPDLGRTRYRSGSISNYSSPFHIDQTFGHNHQVNWGNYGEGSVSVRMQAAIRTSNPNALLANQLGFVNPLSVAWEAVPFSFVVDWFSNVGQVLSACTDFVGLTLEDAFTSTLYSALRSEYWTNTFNDHSSPDSYEAHAVRYVYASRSLGIEGPSLSFKPFKGFSSVRGATAISLLVQTLKSK